MKIIKIEERPDLKGMLTKECSDELKKIALELLKNPKIFNSEPIFLTRMSRIERELTICEGRSIKDIYNR